MFRKVSAALLAFAVAVFGQDPYFYPAPQQYPTQQQYPQGPGYPQTQYPQGQPSPYPQQQPYPPSQGYPQSGYPAYEPQGQPPAGGGDQQHGVARLSIVQGEVNVLRGDNGQLVAAVVNAPLMTQDHLQTSAGSRAEVELDGGNIIRLAPDTDLGFAQVQDQHFQLQLGTGTVIYRVLRKTNAQVEIDTPLMGLVAVTEGTYRLSVLPDGSSQVTVRSGQAQILSATHSEYLMGGHTILVRGNPNNPEFQPSYELAPDQFDDWSGNRDQELMQSQSYNYVSPDVAGAQDLDQYGSWVPSQYGQVWQPQAPPPNWSPYSDGEWVEEPYYGYTWVDAAPWGWAPFHYGRWFWNGGHGWCWWPGPVGAAFWSPALVGFFSWGGFGFGLFGGIGWVALAPFEAFHAWWGSRAPAWSWGRPGYGVVRAADIARMYRNAAFRGGAMTAPYNGFAGPHARFTAATRAQLTNASVFQGRIPVAATRTSFLYSNRQAFSNSTLAAARNRQFFRSPQASFQSRSGFARAPAQNYASRQGSYAAPPQARPSTSGSSGWARFGDPRGPVGTRQGFVGGSEPSGWHSFGEPSPGAAYRNGYQGSYQNPGARQQYSAPRAMPRYSAPQQHYSAPHYSAPRSAPAPSHSGGGGGGSRGGGGSHGGGGGGHGHR